MSIKKITGKSPLKEIIERLNNSYIIRIYNQDLCSDWVFNDNGGVATKMISKRGLMNDLKSNGLEIIKFTFSSFGACYFFEVKGIYNGSIKHEILDEKASSFD